MIRRLSCSTTKETPASPHSHTLRLPASAISTCLTGNTALQHTHTPTQEIPPCNTHTNTHTQTHKHTHLHRKYRLATHTHTHTNTHTGNTALQHTHTHTPTQEIPPCNTHTHTHTHTRSHTCVDCLPLPPFRPPDWNHCPAPLAAAGFL